MKKVLISSLVALLSVSAFADDAKPAAEAAKEAAAPAAEAAKEAAPAAEAAKAEAKDAAGADCKVVIEGNDNMQYNVKDFTIDKAACPEYTIELHHVGKSPKAGMGHNVVLSKTADAAAIAADAVKAGPAKDYMTENDARVIAHTKLLGGGEQDAVTFKTDGLEAGGDYEFFCSFPGHVALMKGVVTVK